MKIFTFTSAICIFILLSCSKDKLSDEQYNDFVNAINQQKSYINVDKYTMVDEMLKTATRQVSDTLFFEFNNGRVFILNQQTLKSSINEDPIRVTETYYSYEGSYSIDKQNGELTIRVTDRYANDFWTESELKSHVSDTFRYHIISVNNDGSLILKFGENKPFILFPYKK